MEYGLCDMALFPVRINEGPNTIGCKLPSVLHVRTHPDGPDSALIYSHRPKLIVVVSAYATNLTAFVKK
jgi:hypothetical protein